MGAYIESLKVQIQGLEDTKNLLVNELLNTILALPDNPLIKRLDKSAFIVRSGNLSSDFRLDPFYYDFEKQYKVLAERIFSSENPMKLIDSICQTGQLRHDNKLYKFNPAVIAHLQSL